MLIWRFFIYFSGNLRRFRRICEHTQSVVSVVRRQPLPPASPRAARRNSTNKSDGGSDSRPQPPSRSTDGTGSRTTGKNEVSDSSSCNSDVSHGIEPNSKNGPSSNVLTVPSGSSTLGTSAVEATASSVTSTVHHESKASPSVATQKVWHYFLISFFALFLQIVWSHQYLSKFQCWNRHNHGKTIHPKQKFNSMNLLQMSCVIT